VCVCVCMCVCDIHMVTNTSAQEVNDYIYINKINTLVFVLVPFAPCSSLKNCVCV